ncbi:hypothetical protein NIES4074_20780 [Cylindrospermum sp. NIES-4074]|nr:hypothetical protein NIES4074_20780 [Cylindrospermum sp. NIES-4074]
MISLKAAHLIIHYFDSIDKVVSKRLVRKRPWFETALTSLLCDLLDQEEQDEYKLEYSFAKLKEDLTALDPYLNASFTIETHEYSSKVENLVTQSDIGIIINFKAYCLPEESWSVAWLLQAKRLSPNRKISIPFRYNEKNRFDIDKDQKNRIDILAKIVGVPFIKYLLYCPRPSMLAQNTEKNLINNRDRSIANSDHILKYLFCSASYNGLNDFNSTLSSGIFVNDKDNLPSNLSTIHDSIFNSCLPLSWFIAEHFLCKRSHEFIKFNSRFLYGKPNAHHMSSNYEGEEWAHGIVSGNPEAISQLIAEIGDMPNIPKNFSFLPAHTININITSEREHPTVEED